MADDEELRRIDELEQKMIEANSIQTARVILFKPSGKYYTEEEWRIPEGDVIPIPDQDRFRQVIGPYDMEFSPDFRRIDGGSVLVESQEPWGYPHLFPNESSKETSK